MKEVQRGVSAVKFLRGRIESDDITVWCLTHRIWCLHIKGIKTFDSSGSSSVDRTSTGGRTAQECTTSLSLETRENERNVPVIRVAPPLPVCAPE